MKLSLLATVFILSAVSCSNENVSVSETETSANRAACFNDPAGPFFGADFGCPEILREEFGLNIGYNSRGKSYPVRGNVVYDMYAGEVIPVGELVSDVNGDVVFQRYR